MFTDRRMYVRTDGRRPIALSPEPFGRRIKSNVETNY